MKSLQLSKPHFIVVIGIPGSGKSTFASRFAETFHAPFVNPGEFLDELQIPTDTDAADGVAEKLLDMVLPIQQTIIYEPITGSRVERTMLARRARADGYEPLFLWVQTDEQTARMRATRATRSQPAKFTDEQYIAQLKRFTPPNTSEKYVVISGMRTYASQAKPLLKRLAESARPPATAQIPQRSEPVTPPSRPNDGRRSVKIM